MDDQSVFVPWRPFGADTTGMRCVVVQWEPEFKVLRQGILIDETDDMIIMCIRLEDGYCMEEVRKDMVAFDCRYSAMRDIVSRWCEVVDGDIVEHALAGVGMTEDRLSQYTYVSTLTSVRLAEFTGGMTAIIRADKQHAQSSTI